MLDIRRGLVIGSMVAICATGIACGSAPEEAAPPTAADAAPAAAAPAPSPANGV